MLFLLFQLGGARYALDTTAVVEVVPRVTWRPVLRAPAGVVGLLDYHGAPVPVLDLCELATGQPAPESYSTRLILVRTPAAGDPAEGGGGRIVGLLAERATSLLQRQPADFARADLAASDGPFHGPVTTDGDGFVHRVCLETLFAGSACALLPNAGLLGGTP